MFTYSIRISGEDKLLVVNGVEHRVDATSSKVESLIQMTLPEVVRTIRGTKNVVGVLGKFKDN